MRHTQPGHTELAGSAVNGRKNETGLSDVFGALILISVVTVAVALIGVAVFSQSPPQKIPALNVDVTTIGNTLYVRHEGGDPLLKGEYQILVDGKNETANFLKAGGATGDWSVGDTLEYKIPGGQNPESIQIVALTGGYSQVILQVQV